MSDESESRDWQLTEPVAGCSSGTSGLTDEPQCEAKETSESDVRRFGNVSAEAVESSVDDDADKCESSDLTESPQLLNCCMLSGIDVSSTNSDPDISVGCADLSTDAELNDARLSAADSDGSLNSTLKGSDIEESSPEHSRTEISTLQPTFSVSIPISTMLEVATKKDENSDVRNADVKSSSSSEPVREAYSPISDAGDETNSCQTPVPSTPPVSSRLTVRVFSPISPFTPRPSAPNTPLSAVPLYWTRDASSSSSSGASFDTSAWSTSASHPESEDGTAPKHHSDAIVSASAYSQANNVTFTQYPSYSCQSGLSHGSLVRPLEVSVLAGHFQDVRFQQQHTGITSLHSYRPSKSRYSSPVLTRHQYHPQSQQQYKHYADTVGGGLSVQSSYSASSQKQDVGLSLGAGKYVTQPASSLQQSDMFTTRSYTDRRSSQMVSGVGQQPSMTSQACVDDSDSFDQSQICQNANSSFSSNGEFMYLLLLVAGEITDQILPCLFYISRCCCCCC